MSRTPTCHSSDFLSSSDFLDFLADWNVRFVAVRDDVDLEHKQAAGDIHDHVAVVGVEFDDKLSFSVEWVMVMTFLFEFGLERSQFLDLLEIVVDVEKVDNAEDWNEWDR